MKFEGERKVLAVSSTKTMSEGLSKRNVSSPPAKPDEGSQVPNKTLPTKKGCYLIEIAVILFFPSLVLQQLLTNFYFKSRLTEEFGGGRTLSKISACDNVNKSSPEYLFQQKIQQNLSSWQIYFLFAEAMIGMFVGLIIGPVTDHLGRKTGITLSLFGSTLKFLSYVLTIKWKLPLWVIIAGSACHGLTGGPGALISSSSSYIADITSPGPGRTFRLSFSLSSASAIAGILAYFYGHIIHVYGHLYAASLLLILNIIDLVFVIFVLTESLPSGGLKKKRDFSLSQIFSPILLYVTDTKKKRRLPLLVLLTIFFLSNSTTIARITFLNLYLINSPLCLNAISMGMFVTITSVGLSFVTLPILKFCQYFLSDTLSIILNLLSAIVGNFLLSNATTSSQVYTAMAVGCGINVSPVMTEGAMSLLVEGHEQGTLFASTSFVNMLAIVVYSIIYNSVYSATVTTNPGFIFQLIAAILVFAIFFQLFLSFVVRKKVNATKDQLPAEKLRTE